MQLSAGAETQAQVLRKNKCSELLGHFTPLLSLLLFKLITFKAAQTLFVWPDADCEL